MLMKTLRYILKHWEKGSGPLIVAQSTVITIHYIHKIQRKKLQKYTVILDKVVFSFH